MYSKTLRRKGDGLEVSGSIKSGKAAIYKQKAFLACKNFV